MAYANSRFGYQQRRTERAINSKRPSYFEEEDSAILDPAILDADIMQSPPDAQLRKASFANNNGVLSPAESQGWEHQYGNGLAIEPTSVGASHQFPDEHNAFLRQNPPPVSTFAPPPHPQNWQFEHGSGHCTPTGGLEFVPGPPPQTFENPQGHPYGINRIDSARGSFSHPGPHGPIPQHFNPSHPDVTFVPAPQVQTPLSPHSHSDWMNMAQQEVERRPVSRRMEPHSPPRTSVDIQRRDGIRKKNGKIDIPVERTIEKIDEMIEQAPDDDTAKELKQQKRLLRNREAALASRQRKKKHTEDLENEQKNFHQSIQSLESQLQTLTLDHQALDRNYRGLLQQFEQAQRIIDVLNDDKRTMEAKHAEETSVLRKRIQILTEQLEAPAMSAAPSSTGFTDFNAEMEALNMGPHDWDNFIMINDLQNDSSDDFIFDPKPDTLPRSPALEKKSSSSTVGASQAKKSSSSDNNSDQPIASGLLFFLLLCGAFVASKQGNSRPTDLPEVPDDVRAAAPAVLDNLLAEAGSSSTPSSSRHGVQRAALEPASSSVPHSTRSRSRLDHVHHHITSPTKQQEIDAAFSIMPSQYESMTSMVYQSHDGRPGSSHQQEALSRPRRSLAETLSNMQEEHTRNSKAAVYTRSLLWDQIPDDVVKQFKELVRDHNEIEARQQRQSNHDDMFPFKVEQ